MRENLFSIEIVILKSRDCLGRTVVHHAAQKGHIEVLKYLICHGGNPNLRDRLNKMPLHLSIVCRGTGQLSLYLAEIMKSKDRDKNTPLHLVCRYLSDDEAQKAIDFFCDVNERNKKGETALHIAVQEGLSTMVECLLEKGADVKAKTRLKKNASYGGD